VPKHLLHNDAARVCFAPVVVPVVTGGGNGGGAGEDGEG